MSETGLGTDKVHAAPLVEFVEMIVTRNLDWQTVGMLGVHATVTALGSLSGPRILQ